jgi:hypothetical protein
MIVNTQGKILSDNIGQGRYSGFKLEDNWAFFSISMMTDSIR